MEQLSELVQGGLRMIINNSFDRASVKNFLLESTAIRHNKTLEQELLSQRRGGLINATILLLIFFWTAFFSDYSGVRWLIIFFLTILLSIIVSIGSFRRLDKKLTNWKVKEDDTSNLKNHLYMPALGGTFTFIGILIIRNMNMSDDAVMSIAPVILVPSTTLLVYMFCKGHYKLKLLRKYCPEIKDLKATDL